jgi:hypothetical protein
MANVSFHTCPGASEPIVHEVATLNPEVGGTNWHEAPGRLLDAPTLLNDGELISL